jgi:hypothetical protein
MLFFRLGIFIFVSAFGVSSISAICGEGCDKDSDCPKECICKTAVSILAIRTSMQLHCSDSVYCSKSIAYPSLKRIICTSGWVWLVSEILTSLRFQVINFNFQVHLLSMEGARA